MVIELKYTLPLASREENAARPGGHACVASPPHGWYASGRRSPGRAGARASTPAFFTYPEANMIRFASRLVTRILGLGLGVALLAGAAAAELQVGDKAPDFTMQGSDGKMYSLKDFHGKSAVVVAWFPKAFTGGCTKECKSLRTNSKTLKELNVAYFTASVDKAEDNKKFAESLDLDYPILSDPDKTVANAYGVMSARGFANRWTFYIDKEGVIKHIEKKVSTDKAAEQLTEKVKELGLEGK
jgi:thioredoxin-dependent peroxiredoxin